MKINVRQLCLILCVFLPIGKLFMMPAFISEGANSDLIISALMSYVLSFSVVILLLWLATKTDETFFSHVEGAFGKVTARIFCVIYALFFVFAAIVPLLENKLFTQSAFFDREQPYIAFAPIFLVIGYISTKRTEVIGRSADLCAPLFFFGFLAVMAMSLGAADFERLLPSGLNEFSKTAYSALKSQIWFLDGAIMLYFVGRIDGSKKGLVWKGALSYAVGMILVLAFLAVFYSIFGSIAPRQYQAIGKISKYFSAIFEIGRADYIFIYILTLVQIFALCVPLIISTECICEAFSIKNRVAVAAVLSGLLLIFLWVLDVKVKALNVLLAFDSFYIYFLFTSLLPLLSPIVWRINEKRRT